MSETRKREYDCARGYRRENNTTALRPRRRVRRRTPKLRTAPSVGRIAWFGGCPRCERNYFDAGDFGIASHHLNNTVWSSRISVAPSLTGAQAPEPSTGNLTIKVVPLPTSLFASILPPCESTIHLTIDRPSPKPAAVRSAVLAERRKNLSKMCGRSSGGMPRPVSVTVTIATFSSIFNPRVILPRRSVYLIALSSRLSSSCLIRNTSALIVTGAVSAPGGGS